MQIKELGHVVLYVTNIEVMSGFYSDTLGFRQIGEGPGVAVFSGGRTHHEMLLIEIGGSPREKHYPEPGLYHIGFKVGDSTEDLRQVLKELEAKNVTIVGSADHHVTHSLYVLDPDGNELELYVDVSDEWKTNPAAVLAPTKRLNL